MIREPFARRMAVAVTLLVSFACVCRGADPQDQARSFFTSHCVTCHDSETKKSGLDFASLSWSFETPKTFERWVKVYDHVDQRTMPPEGEKSPDPKTREAFLKMLHGELSSASLARQKTEGRVVLRRLNRVEYEKTVNELLAIDMPLQNFLPEDSSLYGFDNVAEGLRLSMFQMEQYLEAANVAISAATNLRRQPETVRKRFRYHDEENVLIDAKKDGKKYFRILPDAVVVFDDNSPTAFKQFISQDAGRYRIRISASAFQAIGRPVWLKLYATDFKTKRLLGYFDLPVDEKREVEVVVHLAQGELFDISPYDTNYDAKGQVNYHIGAEAYTGRGVAIQWVEVEGPLFDTWPPASLGRLFGETRIEPVVPTPPDRHAAAYKVVPKDARSAIEPLVRNFASRAFRRPVKTAEVQSYVKLAKAELDEGLQFEDVMRVAFCAVLASPRFLFFEEHPGPLDDWALASRLSYFLWSAPPDDPLKELAAKGTLHLAKNLREQVERMLESPKSQAFVENFLGQWLDLRHIDFTQPDGKLYPEFDDSLKSAMIDESHQFFTQLLREDGGLSNFIQSDFLMLNRRIADHYRIDGVSGEAFRRVPLPRACHRGGVLTQASVLKVTANGTVSSPVLRGAWVLKHLLGEPPPPPPANVPTFEPDSRGATTIREQLKKHRVLSACASCHQQIDPPGFALENFDVIGGWRDRYRTERKNNVKPNDIPKTKFRGRTVWEYQLGPAIDASGTLADDQEFKDIDDFKLLLLQREDQVARNLARQLITYATGAGIQFADREIVEEILTRLKSSGGGLRTLVHEIVQSQTFQRK